MSKKVLVALKADTPYLIHPRQIEICKGRRGQLPHLQCSCLWKELGFQEEVCCYLVLNFLNKTINFLPESLGIFQTALWGIAGLCQWKFRNNPKLQQKEQLKLKLKINFSFPGPWYIQEVLNKMLGEVLNYILALNSLEMIQN